MSIHVPCPSLIIAAAAYIVAAVQVQPASCNNNTHKSACLYTLGRPKLCTPIQHWPLSQACITELGSVPAGRQPPQQFIHGVAFIAREIGS